MVADPSEDLALIVDAVREGGATALRFYGGPVRRWDKPDGSPVSEADLAADETIATVLRQGRPDYGWCSEETGYRAGTGRTFVIDPIDGTRAFLNNDSQWTVVVAVLDGARPVAGAVYRPVGDVLYTAALGAGSARNGTPIAVDPHAALKGATIASPGPVFRDRGLADRGASRAKHVRSCALRLAMVGDGKLDAAITKPGPHHWDLAAADLIVHEAGGTVTTLKGEPPRYDTKETRHGTVIAGPFALVACLRTAVG